MKHLRDKIAELPEDRQAHIAEMAQEQLMQLHIAELRQQRGVPAKEIAARLGMSKSAVSQMEKRTQIGLETLLKYVIATGGRLEIRAVYPDKTETILA